MFNRFLSSSENSKTITNLYHITFVNNLQSIMDKGLIPSTGLKEGYKYPHRIYFLIEDKSWIVLGAQLYKKSIPYVSNELVLLEIKPEIIKKNRLKLKQDFHIIPDMIGVYVESRTIIIPPQYIVIKETEKILN